MKAAELMDRNFVTVGKSERAVNALKLMDARGVDRLLVVEGEKLVGIVTEFDVLSRLMSARKLEVTRLTVSSCMSSNLVVGRPDDDVPDLARVMLDKGISSVPIVDEGGRPLGLVSKRGLVFFAPRLGKVSVAEYYRAVDAKVGMFTKLRQALNTMFNVKYNTLIVVSDSRPVGLVTAKDVAKFVYNVRKIGSVKRPDIVLNRAVVADVMTKRFKTCRLSDKLADAARVILDLLVNVVPVVDKQERLLGVVSRRDVIRALVDNGLL